MKNNTELNESLKKITIALYIIIGVIVVNTLILIVCNNDKFTASTNTNKNDETTTTTTVVSDTTYDVSSFKAITVDELVEAYNGSDVKVIYFGRSTCGHCVTFVPVLKKAQEELGFTPLYLDITTVDSAGADKIYALNSEYFTESFGYTPMTIVVQNGKIIAEQIGSMEYDDLITLLSPHIKK